MNNNYVPNTTIPKPKVKLTGKDGNAFAILGLVEGRLKQAKVPKSVIDEFIKEAMSGDYNHLLQIAMKYCEVS